MVQMKQFLVHTLPGSAVFFEDISDAGPMAQSVPTHQFNSWEEAEKHFLALGASQETLDAVADAVKKTGIARLAF